jgi:aspartate aminotransferase
MIEIGMMSSQGTQSCFGLAPYVRLSYATSEQNLREAVKRIARACRELS